MKHHSVASCFIIKWSVFASVLAYTLGFILWVFFLFYNPYSPEDSIEIAIYPGIVMAVFNFIGVVMSIRKIPVFLLVISLLSFFPIGLYVSGSPGVFKFIGWMNIICFAAAISMYFGIRYEQEKK